MTAKNLDHNAQHLVLVALNGPTGDYQLFEVKNGNRHPIGKPFEAKGDDHALERLGQWVEAMTCGACDEQMPVPPGYHKECV